MSLVTRYRSPYKTCFYDHNQVFSQHLCLPFCQQIRALKEPPSMSLHKLCIFMFVGEHHAS